MRSAAGLLLFLLLPVFAQEAPADLPFEPAAGESALGSFRLQREGESVVVEQYAPQAEGGQFRTNVPGCEDGVRLSTVFGPAPYAVVTRVGEGTEIFSRIVLARRPEAGSAAGGEGPSGDTLTMFDGSLGIDDGYCPVGIEETGNAEVFIRQGRMLASGTRLVYDNGTGLAELAGPVRLRRSGSGDSPEILASASALTFDIDTDLSTLTGEVVVSSGRRTSHADVLVLDEREGLAQLSGTPARSVEGENAIRGDELLYYLDTDDVIVSGGVSGTLDLELD